MSTLQRIYHVLGRLKYWVVIIGIILVNGFLDENSFYMRHKRLVEIDQLRNEIAMLKERYQQDDERLQELNNNPKVVESLAREKYHMKRPNEDVFVIKDGYEEEEREVVEEKAVTPAEKPEPSTETAETQEADEQAVAETDSTHETPAQP
ncbi:MAG: septum formation initiator family protein [Bacteroidaceae bacterium]|nr:septum formation initiator family protein [Bacteroidaceae bacterium]